MKFRGDGLDLRLLLSTSISEYCCFSGRQTAPPPCILGAPGIMSRSPPQGLLVMSQTASPFQSFKFSLKFKIHCLGSWSASLHPRTNFSTWSTLVKNKNTLMGLTFWWRETDSKTKGTVGERYAADPWGTRRSERRPSTQSQMCTRLSTVCSRCHGSRMCQFN